jgi:hypothetical protein
MKRIVILLALLAAGWSNALSAPASRILLIDSSSMAVGAGKATLIIGPLQRTNGVYMGDYKLKVFPYFFKNEKGRLLINVSDEAIAEASQGRTVPITGTATTDGNNGKCRPIGAIATPVDRDHGTLKLWFMAGDRKMIFEPAYHFSGNETTLALTGAPGMNP